MATTPTKLSFEEFQQLPEREGAIYELDEGLLLIEEHLTLRHNLIRQRIAFNMMEFVDSRKLGMVLEETDFHLAADTVRNPDVSFLSSEHAAMIDLDRPSIEGAPALAVEVISPSNSAEDMAKKTQQYLRAGSTAVWIVYPKLRMVEVHSTSRVNGVREPEVLTEPTLLPGFSLSLAYVFDGKE